MKQFYRLPRWLQMAIPAVFFPLCLAINAVALSEMVHSFQSRPAAELLEGPAAGRGPAEVTTRPASSVALRKASATAATKTPTAASAASVARMPKYGHFPYNLPRDRTKMSLIASYAEGAHQRHETLHPDAAAALMEMIAAARTDGVWLVAASGFRTIAQQRALFTAQIAAKGSPEAAAVVSAPPGYSEHHTGYAVDLTDGSVPQSEDISLAFATSPAYHWLLANAATFGFELSFPEGNSQGISYEPWHWRYVGSPEAKAIFSQMANSAANSVAHPIASPTKANDKVVE